MHWFSLGISNNHDLYKLVRKLQFLIGGAQNPPWHFFGRSARFRVIPATILVNPVVGTRNLAVVPRIDNQLLFDLFDLPDCSLFPLIMVSAATCSEWPNRPDVYEAIFK